eukprot:TRINITY_DN1617_c3_g1_i2.p1 TRINITY_DN1617_c3_g1~~TRINITY_DN1617_c3_g1_i2.p1  ORF type:complete len:811 (+),score=125.97 TRINITY_DN1617_c3_g1_i2:58-2490(+)
MTGETDSCAGSPSGLHPRKIVVQVGRGTEAEFTFDTNPDQSELCWKDSSKPQSRILSRETTGEWVLKFDGETHRSGVAVSPWYAPWEGDDIRIIPACLPRSPTSSLSKAGEGALSDESQSRKETPGSSPSAPTLSIRDGNHLRHLSQNIMHSVASEGSTSASGGGNNPIFGTTWESLSDGGQSKQEYEKVQGDLEWIDSDGSNHTEFTEDLFESEESKPPEPTSKYEALKKKLNTMLEIPSSSLGAQILAAISLLAITGSTVVLCVETLPENQVHVREGSVDWFAVETGFVIFFTIELLVRLWASDNRLEFCKRILNILDLVAILPYYVELIVAGGAGGTASSGLRVLRVIRVVRVFRLLRIARYAEGIQLVATVMSQLGDVLVLVLFVIGISLMVWSSCLFYFEGFSVSSFDRNNTRWTRENDVKYLIPTTEYSPFQSITATFWWCISTITVVGYGDEVPYSPAAKGLASFAMLSGTFIIAIPASVFGSNFLSEHHRRGLLKKEMKHKSEDDHCQIVSSILNVSLGNCGVQENRSGGVSDEIITRLLWDDNFNEMVASLAEKYRDAGRGLGKEDSDFLQKLKALHSRTTAEEMSPTTLANNSLLGLGPPGISTLVNIPMAKDKSPGSTPESSAFVAQSNIQLPVQISRFEGTQTLKRRKSGVRRKSVFAPQDEALSHTVMNKLLRNCQSYHSDLSVKTLRERDKAMARDERKLQHGLRLDDVYLNRCGGGGTSYAASSFGVPSDGVVSPPQLVLIPATPDGGSLQKPLDLEGSVSSMTDDEELVKTSPQHSVYSLPGNGANGRSVQEPD